MGNIIHSGRGRVKLMKLNGEMVKRKPPVSAEEIMKDFPGHVVLHSEAVRHVGVKAKPLDKSINLKPGHLYFVIEKSKLEGNQRVPRRVRSGISMNAQSRLENLLLSRRSVSDVSIINSSCNNSDNGEDSGAFRVKVRLTKTQLAKMIAENEGSSETTQKILDSCLTLAQSLDKRKEEEDDQKHGSSAKSSLGSIPESCKKAKVLHNC